MHPSAVGFGPTFAASARSNPGKLNPSKLIPPTCNIARLDTLRGPVHWETFAIVNTPRFRLRQPSTIERFSLGLHTSEEKGDWLTALQSVPWFRKMPRGPGASPHFPSALRA